MCLHIRQVLSFSLNKKVLIMDVFQLTKAVKRNVFGYHRTGFKCDNLLNSNAFFFLSSQKLERNSYVTDNYVIVTRAVPEWLHYSDVKAT